MSTVKVHEWCLVCYGWLALCLRNNFHLTYLFSCLFSCVSTKQTVGFLCCLPCYGIVLIDGSCLRLVSQMWHRMDLEAISLHHIFNACIDVVAH